MMLKYVLAFQFSVSRMILVQFQTKKIHFGGQNELWTLLTDNKTARKGFSED